MINPQEIKAILKLDSFKRFVYSIKKIVDFEEIWVISNEEGHANYGDENGVVFPVWPAQEYAQLCCMEEFSDCKPESITLDDFVETYLPDFIRDNYRIGLLPLPWGESVVVPVETFLEAIEKEQENY